MFLAFLSFAIVGIVLFLSIIAFYNKKKFSEIKGRSPRYNLLSVHKVSDTGSAEKKEKGETGEEEAYIPVLHIDEEVPGLSQRELIHYFGSGILYNVDTSSVPVELEFEQNELVPVVEGRLALTSKSILIYNNEVKKKIYISSIEKHHFNRSFLIIKRKNVKKKKDIIMISPKPVEFKYILHTLIK